MTRSFTPRLGAYAGLAAAGLLAALVTGAPELVALAAPFALAAVLDLALADRPQITARFRVPRERILEGERIAATLALSSPTGAERLEVLLDLPHGLAATEAPNPVALHMPPRGRRELEWVLRADRWGGYAVGRVHLRVTSRFGVVRYESEIEPASLLKVYPRAEYLRALVRPYETQVFAGNQVAREKGEGIEFADLRPFVPGDRIRRVNWRASARRGVLWVNERHAERNADVVVFLDTFAEARTEEAGTLETSVRAAAALVEGYLRERDRVGLVGFGGILNWVVPGSGLRQLYRIVDSLLDTEIIVNFAWKDIDVLPRRTLPPQALVVALTPLIDERAVTALLDLRARGFDLAIVEVSPLPYASPGDGEDERLAYRLWRLRRDALRGRYERAGVSVTVWDEDVPLAAALEEVRSFRRFATRARR